jgi:chromosome segregation and condensation protein ScpB
MDDEMISVMIEKGYLEEAGINEAGDPLYKITKKFYDEQADLVEWMKQKDSDVLSSLWFKGFIDLKMSEEGMGYIYTTGISNTWLDSEELTEDEKSMMYLIYSTGAYHKGEHRERKKRN